MTTVNTSMAIAICRDLERSGEHLCFHCYVWGSRSGNTERGTVGTDHWVEVRLNDVQGPRQMHLECVWTFVAEQRELIQVHVIDARPSVLQAAVDIAFEEPKTEPAAPEPLSRIPEEFRTYSKPPEEYVMSLTAAVQKFRNEVVDKGVMTLIGTRVGTNVQCKVLIVRDQS